MTKATNTTKTTSTTKSTSKSTSKYISKLIVNGQLTTTTARQVITTIKGTEITLNCCYISEHELKDCYTSAFNFIHNDKKIEVHYAKLNNRVSATLYINDIIVFSSMSMQAIFTILNTAYGISKNYLNSMYIKSNGMRKQSSSSVNKVIVKDTFEF